MTIGEVSRLTGVTIRTLRHYDHIGLLRPAQVTGAGYRLYDEGSLRRLHAILLFRELELPLEDVRRILDAPDFDEKKALAMQRTLLLMHRRHIDRLIALTNNLEQKGMNHMDFTAFDKRKAEDYAAQAEAAWGHTDAWQDYAKRERTRQPGENQRSGEELMALLAGFGHDRPASPDSPEASAFVRKLQAFITQRFYTCTDAVLLGLADMYETADFRRNIDRAGGEGTAALLAAAIRCCCGQEDA